MDTMDTSRTQALEHDIHRLFRVSLILKGLFALGEMLSGIALFFVSQDMLMNVIWYIIPDDLPANPADAITAFFVDSIGNLSGDTQHFAALYLASHGIIKALLIVNLLREKFWAYPLAITVFGFFIFYQLFRYAHTHSIWLLILTVFDVIIIWLTWHEYRQMRQRTL